MLTIKQFCEFVKISERYFHVLKAQGLAPELTRSGRRVLISSDAAKEWLAAHERRAA
jgi:hypothetical protein